MKILTLKPCSAAMAWSSFKVQAGPVNVSLLMPQCHTVAIGIDRQDRLVIGDCVWWPETGPCIVTGVEDVDTEVGGV